MLALQVRRQCSEREPTGFKTKRGLKKRGPGPLGRQVLANALKADSRAELDVAWEVQLRHWQDAEVRGPGTQRSASPRFIRQILMDAGQSSYYLRMPSGKIPFLIAHGLRTWRGIPESW